MRRWLHISPIGITFRVFRSDGSPNYGFLLSIVLLCSFQAIAVSAGSYFDGTWHNARGGTGFLAHYGVWAVLVSDPLLLISAGYAYRRFRIAMSRLPLNPEEDTKFAVNRILRPHIDRLHLRRKGAWLYVLFVTIGVTGWLDNLHRTNYPLEYFGHDVFDSTSFTWGYIATKFALFNSWILIYPAVGFLLISMSLATRSILIRLTRKSLIKPHVLHPDGSFGLAELGKLNVSLLFPYVLSFATLFAVMITHGHAYSAAAIPLLALSLLFISVSYLTISPVLSQLRDARKTAFKRLAIESQSFGKMNAGRRIAFAAERLSYALSKRSPYSINMQIAVSVLRLTPFVLTASKLFLH